MQKFLMKKLFGIALISLSSLFVTSCSKDSTVESPDHVSHALGSVSFRIDKVNAPQGVSLLTAYLSRPDCDTLEKNLNLYAETASQSADVLFENIKTGTWHLKIIAKDNAGEILYSGETDIYIEDSKTTEVYLTLTPRPAGTGSIYISVKWGTNLTWSDYPGNPIYVSQNSPTKPMGGVSMGKVIFENGKYKMWYSNTYESARIDIGYAESADGLHWVSAYNEPVLKRGEYGAWDYYSVTVTCVIIDDGIYRMFYTGLRDYGVSPSVGMAVSTDGIHWTKQASPILTLSGNETHIGATGVVKKDGIYYLYFATFPDWRIHLATSQDGLNYYRYSGNPILTATQDWEAGGIIYPSVVYDGTQFKMIYNNYNRNALGMAVSSDGIHWTKSSGNPVFGTDKIRNRWTSNINYPFYFLNGTEQRIYYTGTADGMNNVAVALYN